MNVLRIEANNDAGMTIGEFKKALEKAEVFGMTDDDIIKVDVIFSFRPNGAPIRRVYIPVGD